MPEDRRIWIAPDGSTWREVTPPERDPVGLSGPGLMRSYKEVTREELESKWKRVALKSV